MAANLARDESGTGWRAELELELELALADDRTRITKKRHIGPLCIQKPFHPGDGSCHVYLLHPPGGLAGGDRLDVSVRVGTDAAALVTMPASTKFYRSGGPASSLCNSLAVAPGAILEWLPPETILFGGARAEMATRVELAASARFIGWETLVLGRPLSGDHFRSGSFEQRFELFVEGKPILLERMQAQANERSLEAPWGWGAHPVMATMLAYPAEAVHVTAVREALDAMNSAAPNSAAASGAAASGAAASGAAANSAGARTPDARPGPDVGVTLIDELLVVRALGRDVRSLRPLLDASWQELRQPLLERRALAPRIWNT